MLKKVKHIEVEPSLRKERAKRKKKENSKISIKINIKDYHRAATSGLLR